MALDEKQMKRLTMAIIIALFGVVAFISLRPIILPVIGGLILAYIFYPVYKKLIKHLNRPNLTASIVLLGIVLILIVPIWFLVPIMMQQVFEIFRVSQSFEVQGVIANIFPTASEQLVTQLAITFDTFVSKTTSAILNVLVDFFLSVPMIMLNIFIIGFVCFFALRDQEDLREFVRGISPFGKSHEKILIKQFREITDAIIYGQVIIGILQGILAGVALILLGVPNALVLTSLAIILSILPIVGPLLVWAPVVAYLFFADYSNLVIIVFLIYNILIVSNVDNLVRTYIISKKTKLSQVIVLIGMVGGLFIFGVIGLILGPLILAFFLTLLRSYQDKDIYSIFSD